MVDGKSESRIQEKKRTYLAICGAKEIRRMWSKTKSLSANSGSTFKRHGGPRGRLEKQSTSQKQTHSCQGYIQLQPENAAKGTLLKQ